jgi:hypothetical protein
MPYMIGLWLAPERYQPPPARRTIASTGVRAHTAPRQPKTSAILREVLNPDCI